MKPTPSENLWLSFALDTLFLPRSHPPGIYYHHPSPAGVLTAYQPLTPSFWAWFQRQLAAFRTSHPDEVARSAPIRAELTEYVTLRYTAQSLAAAAPAVWIDDGADFRLVGQNRIYEQVDPEDLVRMSAFASDPAARDLWVITCLCGRKAGYSGRRPPECWSCRKPYSDRAGRRRLAWRPRDVDLHDNYEHWVPSE